jgi:hypothetical protein
MKAKRKKVARNARTIAFDDNFVIENSSVN